MTRVFALFGFVAAAIVLALILRLTGAADPVPSVISGREPGPELDGGAPALESPAPGRTTAAPTSEPAAPEPDPSAAGSFRPADYTGSGPFTRPPSAESGAIHGRVVRGSSPVPGAEVSAWRAPEGLLIGPPTDVLHRTDSDPDGYFTIPSVGSGPWSVGASWEGAFTSGSMEVAAAGETSRGVLLVFGTATIIADVRDGVGTRLAGTPVAVNGIGPAPTRACHLITDHGGLARFTQLVAGRYYVQTRRPGEEPLQRMIEIAPGEERTVLMGNDAPPVRWTGRTVDGAGDPIMLGFNLRLVHAQRRDERWLRLKGSEFEVNIVPGLWEVWRQDEGLGLGELYGKVEIPERPFTQDIVLPGTQLELQLADSTGDVRLLLISEVNDLGASPRLPREPDRLDGNTVQFFAVPPGTHVLEIQGKGQFGPSHGKEAAGTKRLAITLSASDDVMKAQLEINGSPQRSPR